MVYDEGLAERVREALADEPGVTEKRMFGGIAFMARGHMCVGIVKDELMVRVGAQSYAELVRRPHARPMDFTGRPMVGFLFVAPGGLAEADDLRAWIAHGLSHAASLPAKEPRDPGLLKPPKRAGARRAAPKKPARKAR